MAEKQKEELTDTQKTRLWVNVPFNSPEELELREKLEIMVKEHGGTNNAAYIRLLISQEWERRQQAKKVEAHLRKKGLIR